MQHQHTLGPWTAGLTNSRGVQACVIGAKNDRGFTPWVCHIQTADIETGNANARLIAAAPDLLEAIQDLLNQFEQRGVLVDPQHPDRIAVEQARVALAKAIGSSMGVV
jgi:hypothetical protein